MTTDTDTNVAERQEAEALAFSRPLDIHRWSDHRNTDALVDEVCGRCLKFKPSNILRKHFKVVLLDLYVASFEHPDLKLAVPMGNDAYKAKGSRYNALKISKKVIEVVDLLYDTGLIDMKLGFYDRQTRQGKRTRIWPTAKLKKLFDQCQLDAYQVSRAPDEEVIILRNENGDNEEYDDTTETHRMRRVVRGYNALLARKFIDIRRLDQPSIKLNDGTNLMLGPSRQQVYRVFNRSDFAKGGRFFGPWWQGCPKAWRKEIFIDDAPTIEQDYSSLHIALLYARKGINYYTAYEGDAYQLETPAFLTSSEQTRKYAKLLLLMAVNAKTDKKAYAAFRSHRNERKDRLGGSLTDDQLSVLLDGLRQKHPVISDGLGSDAGIDLMNEDSRITEHVIERFTALEIPVLTVHDSYIVNFAYHELLQQVLEEGFSMVTGLTGVRSERTGVALGDEASWKTQRLEQETITRSMGYNQRLLNWMIDRNAHNNGE